MKIKRWLFGFVASAVLAMMLPASTGAAKNGPNIVTFDVPAVGGLPAAGTNTGEGTFAAGIIQGNWIFGWYTDGNDVNHGFLRAPWGQFSTFDPPGSINTQAWGMNDNLVITGVFVDANGENHGFVRTPDGNITTFDAPGLGVVTQYRVHTFGCSINNAGVISGIFRDEDRAWHGIVRTPDGHITKYDVPGEGTTGPGEGVHFCDVPQGINQAGAISGVYVDDNYLQHSYIRYRDGSITTFDPPNSYPSSDAGGINPEGEVEGYYIDDTIGAVHGFVRTPGGRFEEFDAPGAWLDPDRVGGTFPSSINSAGDVVGSVVKDASGQAHGFVRSQNGKFKMFDPPGSTYTVPYNSTPAGVVTGYFYDAGGVVHGFMMANEK